MGCGVGVGLTGQAGNAHSRPLLHLPTPRLLGRGAGLPKGTALGGENRKPHVLMLDSGLRYLIGSWI